MAPPWPILMCLCIVLLKASTFPLEDEIITVDEKDLANEAVEMAICYGYVIDADSPNYLGRGDKIFNVDRNRDLAISSKSEVTVKYVYSDSEQTVDKKVATSLSVSGHYGAFSASASMKTSHSSSENTKTVRMDAIVKAQRYEVSSKGEFRTYPSRFLADHFKEAVRNFPPEEIEKKIGIFYATKLSLGGEIRKSYVMQATRSDTEASISAELKASYGGGMMGVAGSAGVGVSTRKSNKNARVAITWAARGGRTEVWLGMDFSKPGTSLSGVAKEWAKTIDDNNFYPADYKLRPMWEMVEAVDAAKGAAFKKYCLDKWGQAANAFRPTKYLVDRVTYTIRIQTGHTNSNSKTDNMDCQLTICGKFNNGNLECVKLQKVLDNPNKDDFEVRQTDTFVYNGEENIGEITCVKLQAIRGDDGWEPSWIGVKSTYSTREKFFYNTTKRWLYPQDKLDWCAHPSSGR